MRGVAWGVGSATNQTQDGGLEMFPQERMPELRLKKSLRGGLRPEGQDLRQVGSTRQCPGALGSLRCGRAVFFQMIMETH